MAEYEKIINGTTDIVWLKDIDKEDISIGGGKGANLAEMWNAGFPVPDAFIVTAGAFRNFIVDSGLDKKIMEIITSINMEDTQQIEDDAKYIQRLVVSQEMPDKLKQKITEAYKKLSFDEVEMDSVSSSVRQILKNAAEEVFVAVRSSATAEDLAGASFAGQQETFVNIRGEEDLLEAVKKCWASLFTARAIYYRNRQGFDQETAFIAVVVQKMINSDKSGVMFTANPMTRDRNEIVIESVYGLGEGIVSGAVEPDHYVVDKQTKQLKGKRIGSKKTAFIRDSDGKNKVIPVKESHQKVECLNFDEIRRLTDLAIKIENHYGKPQDIEFSIDFNAIYIVQSRPITTLEKKAEEKSVSKDAKLLLDGLAASPGIGSGPVKIIERYEDLPKIKKGDILVTKMTNPDMVVTMQKCAGIVTDEGGATAHAAIVSREIGIPCVVGTKEATKRLKDGQMVTVDGSNGVVYEGSLSGEITKKEEKEELPLDVETQTKIKVVLDLPSSAERAAKTNADGVGLLRLEGIIAESGKHPAGFINKNNAEGYVNILMNGIIAIASQFKNKPVWIRTSDIRSDEYRHLEGADKNLESNPMLGWHGIRRSLDEPQILKAELEAIKRVVKENDDFIIGIMFPQIISVEEVRKIKKIAKEVGIVFGKGKGKVEFGVMIETPAAVQIIKDLCYEGIDFISFGTNDLTQYTLAVDRNNEKVQKLYNEMHPAVLRQIFKVLRVCQERNVETSICGQAGSKSEMIRYLVKEGIDSISANIDAVNSVRKIVYEVEKEFEN